MNYRPNVRFGFVLLHADGTETRVVTFDPGTNPFFGASLSPDGSQVVFVEERADTDFAGIYAVDSRGGTPRLLRSTPTEPFILQGWHGMLYEVAFSPDGTQVAYFHGGGDHSHHLMVMNADGTNAKVLSEQKLQEASHVGGLVWSPDGSHLAFATDGLDATWDIRIIGADGSGYRRVTAPGESPSWSPDGSRIAFRRGDMLFIVAPDGSGLEKIGEVSWGGAIVWNPAG